MRLCVQLICAVAFLLREASSFACSKIDLGALQEGKDSQLLNCTAGDLHHDLMTVASKIVEADSDKAYSILTLLLSNVGCPSKLADLLEGLSKEKPELHLAVLGECYDLKNLDLLKVIPSGTFLHKFIQEIDGATGEGDVLDLQAEQSFLMPILPNLLLRQVRRGKTSPKWSSNTIEMMIANPLANGRLKRAVRTIAQDAPSQLATLKHIAGRLMYHEDYLLAILEAIVLAHQHPTTLDQAIQTIGVDRIRGILDLFKDIKHIELQTFNVVAGLVDPSKVFTPAVVEGVPTVETPDASLITTSVVSEATLVIPRPPPPPPPPPPLVKSRLAKGRFMIKPEEFSSKKTQLKSLGDIHRNIQSAFKKGEGQHSATAKFDLKVLDMADKKRGAKTNVKESETEGSDGKFSDDG